MGDRTDILISLSQPYVDHVLSGRKTVELRRRTVSVSPGTRVWIYAKSPEANFPAVATVREIVLAAPSELWKQFSNKSGVSLSEFKEYFVGVSKGCAIVFESVQILKPAVSLSEIQERARDFRPPQFFKRLPQHSPELDVLMKRIATR